MSELNDCMRALEQTGRREKPVSSKVAKAMAIGAGTRTPERAALARRIMQLERQQNVQKALGMFAPSVAEAA